MTIIPLTFDVANEVYQQQNNDHSHQKPHDEYNNTCKRSNVTVNIIIIKAGSDQINTSKA